MEQKNYHEMINFPSPNGMLVKPSAGCVTLVKPYAADIFVL